MFGISFDPSVLVGQRAALEAALSADPKNAEALRRHIRTAVLAARREVSAAARGRMSSDPRGAAGAVRSTVYRRVLGANLNILNARRRHGTTAYQPARKLDRNPFQWGGNRTKRSARTQQVMSYAGADRAFILRFVDSGTAERTTRYGNRGRISARHFFAPTALRALERAAAQIAKAIDTELARTAGGKA